jgi:hypothetical protein
VSSIVFSPARTDKSACPVWDIDTVAEQRLSCLNGGFLDG